MKNAQFLIVPPKPGKVEWTIKVTFSEGKARRVTGFTSEAVAAEWIAKASATYLRELEKPWNPLRRREKFSVWNPIPTKRKAPPKRG
jgi:hypothetical protein